MPSFETSWGSCNGYIIRLKRKFVNGNTTLVRSKNYAHDCPTPLTVAHQIAYKPCDLFSSWGKFTICCVLLWLGSGHTIHGYLSGTGETILPQWQWSNLNDIGRKCLVKFYSKVISYFPLPDRYDAITGGGLLIDSHVKEDCFPELIRVVKPGIPQPHEDAMASLQWRHNGHDGVSITCLAIVYSTVYSGADHRKHQSCASLDFVRGIHRWPVNSPQFPTQRASNAESVSIWWRHHDGNVFRIAGTMWRQSTCDCWIPLTKGR